MQAIKTLANGTSKAQETKLIRSRKLKVERLLRPLTKVIQILRKGTQRLVQRTPGRIFCRRCLCCHNWCLLSPHQGLQMRCVLQSQLPPRHRAPETRVPGKASSPRLCRGDLRLHSTLDPLLHFLGPPMRAASRSHRRCNVINLTGDKQPGKEVWASWKGLSWLADSTIPQTKS